MRRSIFLLFAGAILFVGCAPSGSYIRTSEARYGVSRWESIMILGQTPDKPFEVVGIVTAKKEAVTKFDSISEEELIPELKRQAAMVGADAVMNLQFDSYHPGRRVNALRVRGNAIRYK